MSIICGVLAGIIPSTASAAPISAETWPQWRGPSRDGYATKASWPDSLASANLRQLWKVDLQPSYSGPIVAEGKVFTTETQDKKNEVVTALDAATGKLLWTRSWKGAMSVPFFARSNGSWIRSTPAYDDGRLFVAGMKDHLVCLDTSTGEVLWEKNFVDAMSTPVPSFGFVCSPLVVGDHVVVQAAASLVCLNKKTGDVVWRSLKDKGGMYGSAFSSPVLTQVDGKDMLVVLTREKLAGVDPATGKVLWTQKVKAYRGMNILTPAIYKERVLTAAYGGKTHLFEIPAQESQEEVQEEWTYKAQGYMSSPVILGTHAWLHLKNQRLLCLDLETGKEQWTTSERFGKYWSMVTNGEKILALDQRGQLLLLRANPEKFDLMDEREIIDQPTWAHLAMAGNRLYIRSLEGLMAYEWSNPATQTVLSR